MTGMHVRVKRPDGWTAVEIDELTDAELELVVSLFDPAQARRWVVGLAKWIRELGRLDDQPSRGAKP